MGANAVIATTFKVSAPAFSTFINTSTEGIIGLWQFPL